LQQTSLCQSTQSDKKRLEKEVADLKSEIIQIQSVSDEKSEDLKSFRDQLDEKLQLIQELEGNVKELKNSEHIMKVDFEKQISRLERAVESNAKKVEKLNEEKKAKLAQMKEAATKHSDIEASLVSVL
jgi:chromosome segregation ATPase